MVWPVYGHLNIDSENKNHSAVYFGSLLLIKQIYICFLLENNKERTVEMVRVQHGWKEARMCARDRFLEARVCARESSTWMKRSQGVYQREFNMDGKKPGCVPETDSNGRIASCATLYKKDR